MMETSSDSGDFSDTIFWFLHENSDSSASSSEWAAEEYVDDENEDSVNSDHDGKTAFWHDQEQLLLATLCRTTSTESRVRQATEYALRDSAPPCHCKRAVATGGCRSCLMEETAKLLCRAGFDCSIRNSKWSKSSNIPSGEHSYLEVVEEVKKKTVIVELYFRAEFEMAMAGDLYNHLVGLLPEVFVGRPEKLRNVVKIMSVAAKRCMKENSLHVPPWRRLKYMQSKWFSTTTMSEMGESVAADSPQEDSPVVGFSGSRSIRRPRASLLTSALLGNFPGTHGRSVAVV